MAKTLKHTGMENNASGTGAVNTFLASCVLIFQNYIKHPWKVTFTCLLHDSSLNAFCLTSKKCHIAALLHLFSPTDENASLGCFGQVSQNSDSFG